MRKWQIALIALISLGAFPSITAAETISLIPDTAGSSYVGLQNVADGKLVGAIASLNGEARFEVAKIGADGNLDQTFGSGGFVEPFADQSGLRVEATGLATSKTGRVAVVGFRSPPLVDGELPRMRAPLVALMNGDGSLVNEFSGDGRLVPPLPRERGAIYHDVAFRPGGGLIVVGSGNEHRETGGYSIVRAFRPNGEIDRTFGKRGQVAVKQISRESAGSNRFDSIKIFPNGQILISGMINGNVTVLKFDSHGKPVRRFGSRGRVRLRMVQDQCDVGCLVPTSLAIRKRQIFVSASPEQENVFVARMSMLGSPDRRFGRAGVAKVPLSAISRAIPSPDTGGRAEVIFAIGLAVTSSLKPTVVGSTIVEMPTSGDVQSRATTIALNKRGMLAESFGDRGIHLNLERTGSISSTAIAAGNSVIVGGAWFDGSDEDRVAYLTLDRFSR